MHKQVPRARWARIARKREEGAVLLVVLIVIMVATTSAAVSVANTQSEVRAVGQERAALHGRYAAEAAMVATIAWFDDQDARGLLSDQYMRWKNASQANQFPEMREFGERPVTNTNHTSGRLRASLQTFNAPPVGPVSVANAITEGAGPTPAGAGGSTGGSGGAAGATPGVAGPIDSFGPNPRGLSYTAAPYIVDVTECTTAADTESPGAPAGGQETGIKPVSVHCTLTARARLMYGDAATHEATRTWSFDGLNNFTLPRYSTKHTARAVVILGPIYQ
jgi:hypothetical protein